ncbi:hypothetical protein SBA4_3260002 [Candidatus Sulfopaludibacter sp. SbA4]|nr:hypothetical protein SBA4_3260002 [Candidatus Sulfopaludibacter sp. SbA4]
MECNRAGVDLNQEGKNVLPQFHTASLLAVFSFLGEISCSQTSLDVSNSLSCPAGRLTLANPGFSRQVVNFPHSNPLSLQSKPRNWVRLPKMHIRPAAGVFCCRPGWPTVAS